MTLSLDLILMYLEKYDPEYLDDLPINRRIERIKLFVSGETAHSGEALLVHPEDIESARNENAEAILCTVNNYNEKEPSAEKNLIIFKGTDQPAVLFNAYTQLINDLSSWKDLLCQALLQENDLSRLLEIAQIQLHYPIVSLHPDFTVAAFRIGSGAETDDFETVVELGYTPTDLLEKERFRNMGGRIMKQERAIIERGLKDPSSYNLFRGHRMGDRFGGVTIIFGGKSKPRPGYMELCEMFFSVMDLYLKLHEPDLQTRSLVYESLFSLLMKTEHFPERRLTDQLRYINFPAEGIFTLVVLDFAKEDYYYTYYLQTLRTYFPDLYFFVYEGEIYLLFHTERGRKVYHHKKVMETLLQLIRKRLGKTVPVHFRISNPFDRISDLFYAGKQCHILADLELTNGTEELFGVDLKNAKTRMKLYMALDAGL